MRLIMPADDYHYLEKLPQELRIMLNDIALPICPEMTYITYKNKGVEACKESIKREEMNLILRRNFGTGLPPSSIMRSYKDGWGEV